MKSNNPFVLSGKNGCGGSVNKLPPTFPFIIGVAGGSSSGKTEVCERIVEALGQNGKSVKERQVFVINQDSFYQKFDRKQLEKASAFDFNFDHPNAVDLDALKECLKSIKRYESVVIPQYNYVTHQMNKEESSTLTIHSADVVIVEGILVFYDKELRELFDLKLFVDTDSDTRLARRVVRDTEMRNRDLDSVLIHYTRYVKPTFEEFCLPTKKYADVIIPRGTDNNIAVSLIVQHIQDLLQCNAANSRRNSCGKSSSNSNSARSSGTSSKASSIPGSPLNCSSEIIPKVIPKLINGVTNNQNKSTCEQDDSSKCTVDGGKGSGAASTPTAKKSLTKVLCASSQVNSISTSCHVEQGQMATTCTRKQQSVHMTNGVH